MTRTPYSLDHPMKTAYLLLCLLVSLAAPSLRAQNDAAQPMPDPRQLMLEVELHQRQLDKLRENYTYSALQTTQMLDPNGRLLKSLSLKQEDFFVNSHFINRTVEKDGRPLSASELRKETERVTKLVEKAEKTPPGEPLNDSSITVTQLLKLMQVSNPRRQSFRGRPTILFDFIGRKDAKTKGAIEDVSKKLRGTVWVDELDRQIAHVEVTFNDNFRVAGGLLVTIQKGSSFSFDQAPVNGELWLPIASEAFFQARFLMLKNIRAHITEHNSDFQRFRVETLHATNPNPAPPPTI